MVRRKNRLCEVKTDSKRFRGAGVIEYIVIVATVIGIFLLFFWSSLAEPLQEKLNEIGIQAKVPGTGKTPKYQEPEPGSTSGGGGSMGGAESGSGTAPIPVSSGTRRRP